MVELGEHCHTHIIPRLKKVIDGEDPGGVTEADGLEGRRRLPLLPARAVAAGEGQVGQLGHQQGVQRRDAGRGDVQAGRLHLRAERDRLLAARPFHRAGLHLRHDADTSATSSSQQLSEEVGDRAVAARAVHRVPRQGRPLPEPDREEDPQDGALALRVGPRRLQPRRSRTCRKAPPEAAGAAGKQRCSASARRTPNEPPRQRHRRPPEPARAAARSRWKSSTASREIVPPQKGADAAAALAAIRSEFPTVTDFEREFPSLCFALATGVGKTRLMGAFIGYLHLAHGINNFFVLAPNLTIYNKLIADFTPNTPKYVFKGIAEFATDAAGDHHRRQLREPSAQRRCSTSCSRCKINIFNISKINSEVRGGKSPAHQAAVASTSARATSSIWPSSPDLVLLMDESHRYRASAGVRAINELKPILGLELTATP